MYFSNFLHKTLWEFASLKGGYLYGGTYVDDNDCTGLVFAVLHRLGVNIAHLWTVDLYNRCTPTPDRNWKSDEIADSLKLVFFGSMVGENWVPNHVGFATPSGPQGPYGPEQILHSNSTFVRQDFNVDARYVWNQVRTSLWGTGNPASRMVLPTEFRAHLQHISVLISQLEKNIMDSVMLPFNGYSDVINGPNYYDHAKFHPIHVSEMYQLRMLMSYLIRITRKVQEESPIARASDSIRYIIDVITSGLGLIQTSLPITFAMPVLLVPRLIAELIIFVDELVNSVNLDSTIVDWLGEFVEQPRRGARLEKISQVGTNYKVMYLSHRQAYETYQLEGFRASSVRHSRFSTPGSVIDGEFNRTD